MSSTRKKTKKLFVGVKCINWYKKFDLGDFDTEDQL